jgi:hypothetical protein
MSKQERKKVGDCRQPASVGEACQRPQGAVATAVLSVHQRKGGLGWLLWLRYCSVGGLLLAPMTQHI